MNLARIAPPVTVAILIGPLAFGLAGTVLPAFGYLPVLGGTRLTLEPFLELFAMPGIAHSGLVALVTGLVTTAIAFVVTTLFVAGWADTRAFARLQHLVSPLLAVPHAAAAFGLAFLVAPAGFLFRLVSPWLTGLEQPPDLLIVHDPYGLAMITGLVIKEIPFLFLITLAALPQLRLGETRRLAASLGYGPIAGFTYLLMPAVYGQIRLAVYAVIAYASSVVDVATILGPTLSAPLPVRLLTWMGDPDLAMRFVASAGALLQLAITLCALFLWFVAEKATGFFVRRLCGEGIRFRRDRWLRRLTAAAMAISAGLVFAGVVLLGLWSVAGLWQFPHALPDEFTLGTWARSLPEIVPPLETTLAVAAVSASLAVMLVIGCLERERATGRSGGRRALVLVYIPLIVPQIAFVFGLQVLVLSAGLAASFAALVFVHLVFVLPYVFLSLADPWRSLDRRYDIVAAALGQPRGRALFRVRLPMLVRAVLTAAAVGFAVSVGQYLPTVLIGAGRLTTVTTEAVALASGGNARIIGVYAFLQAALPFAGFAVASLLPALLFRYRRALRA